MIHDSESTVYEIRLPVLRCEPVTAPPVNAKNRAVAPDGSNGLLGIEMSNRMAHRKTFPVIIEGRPKANLPDFLPFKASARGVVVTNCLD